MRQWNQEDEGECWANNTLQDLRDICYDIFTIVRAFQVGRLWWAGHLIKMTQDHIPRMFLHEIIYGTRRVGIPRLQWINGVAADARSILGIRYLRSSGNQERRLVDQAAGGHDSTGVLAPWMMMKKKFYRKENFMGICIRKLNDTKTIQLMINFISGG